MEKEQSIELKEAIGKLRLATRELKEAILKYINVYNNLPEDNIISPTKVDNWELIADLIHKNGSRISMGDGDIKSQEIEKITCVVVVGKEDK